MFYSLAGIALAILAAGFTAGMLTERFNCERHAYDAEIDGYQQPPGRHRAGTPAAPPEPDSGGAPPWEPARTHAMLPPLMPPVPPYLAMAASLTEPQRGRYPDEDTGTLTALTDTGEIRAITDENIAAMRADNAAWLDHWGSGATV
jgi:hypothetical protein